MKDSESSAKSDNVIVGDVVTLYRRDIGGRKASLVCVFSSVRAAMAYLFEHYNVGSINGGKYINNDENCEYFFEIACVGVDVAIFDNERN